MLRLHFDEGEDAFDPSEVVAYETTKRRLDATGAYNPRGQTRIRDATVFLRSGVQIRTTLYDDDWPRFLEAVHGTES